MKIEESLPAMEELEKTVLGTLLVDATCIDRCISDFSSNLFFDKKTKIVAQAIIELYKENTPLDLLTIINKLKQFDKLKEVGGVGYVSSLTQGVMNSINIEHHIRILQQEALKRNLIKIGSNAVNKSFDPTLDVFDVFNEVQGELDNALKNVINYEIKNVGQIHDEIIKKSISILKSGTKSGVPTGLRLLDNVTNGWQRSDLIILAGRPSMGKTAAAISMCIYPAVDQKMPVAIFSLEMSNEQLVSRMQSFFSGVNVSKIVKKQLNDEEIILIDKMSTPLKDAPIFIDDTPNITLLDLKGKCRKLAKENGIQLVVVDYLQLMRSGLKTMSREQEIAEISRGLKSLAKELKIPVIALSQLSRGVEMRGDKKPMLQDLRESGQIEQDADMVLFCYRPEYYEIESYEVGTQSFETHGLFMLLIAKHRNGELGEIPLTFIHEQTKLTNYTFPGSFENTDKNRTFVQQTKPSEEFLENKPAGIKPNNDFDSNNSFALDKGEETLPF